MSDRRPNPIARLTPPTLTAFALFISIASKTLQRRLEDPDLWWHLRTGRLILEERALPSGDPYSFLPISNEWIPHEWGSEVLMHLLQSSFGLRGLIVARTILIVVIYVILARLVYKLSGNRMFTWVLMAIASYAGSVHWSERPNLLSFILFAVFLVLLERRDRWIWLAVPLTALWANLHGMFLLGIGLMSVVAVSEGLKVWFRWEGAESRWARRLGLVAAGTFAASVVNPFGLGLHAYGFRLLGTALPQITEWASPDFHEVAGLLFLVLMLAVLGAMSLGSRRVDPTDVGLTGAFITLGLLAVRNFTVSSMVLAVVIARYFPPMLEDLKQRRPFPKSTEVTPVFAFILNVLTILLVLLAFIPPLFATFPRSDEPVDTTGKQYPVRTIEKLEGDDVRLFTHEFWGGLAIYLRWPEVNVALDGRLDFYGVEAITEFTETMNGLEGSDERLQELCVTHVLIDERAGLGALLRNSEDWILDDSEKLADTDAHLYVPASLPQECSA